MIAAVPELPPPPADAPGHPDDPGHVEALGELEVTLRRLAAVSEDGAQYVAGQALDLATALLDGHARRPTG